MDFMKRKATSNAVSDDKPSLTHADVEEMLLAVNGEIQGLDTDDNEYDSILSLWNSELKPVRGKKKADAAITQAEQKANESEWYRKAFDYWESERNCPITDGNECISVVSVAVFGLD